MFHSMMMTFLVLSWYTTTMNNKSQTKDFWLFSRVIFSLTTNSSTEMRCFQAATIIGKFTMKMIQNYLLESKFYIVDTLFVSVLNVANLLILWILFSNWKSSTFFKLMGKLNLKIRKENLSEGLLSWEIWWISKENVLKMPKFLSWKASQKIIKVSSWLFTLLINKQI